MKDPGLVKYTQEIQHYVGILSSLHNKDVNGLIKIYREIMAQKNGFDYFEYVLVLDNNTNTQQWYKLPTRDVSISAEDMYFKLPKSGSNRYVLFVLIAMIVLVVILLFLICKKQD